MTPEELLKAENAFIRLYNQGVSVDDIAGKLVIDVKTVEQWEAKLKVAVEDRNTSDNSAVIVQGINEKGEYAFQHRIQLTMSGMEKLKFDLWRMSTGTSENLIVQNIIQKASEFLAFTEAHITQFQYRFKEPDGTVDFDYILDEDTIEFRTKVREVVRFYVEYFLRREYEHITSTLIKDKAQDYFSDYTTILPYAIKTVMVEQFQGIHAAELYHLPIDASWIFIMGNNGYGKSTFLQALTVGLFGNMDEDVSLVDDTRTKIGIEYKNRAGNVINNLRGLGFESLKYIACYGPSRLQIQAGMSQNEVAGKSTTTYGLFNSDGILLNIETKLIEWHLEKNVRLEQVKTLFRAVIPYLSDIIVQKNKQDDYEVLYVEQAEDDETMTFDPVPFDKLAAGFRSIIGLIGDLLIRFIRKQPDVADLSDLAGIVLIDELENHLHPKWQYRLPTLLSKVFPNIQFIAATHSVIPILGAPQNSIFLKLNRSKEQGITVERVDIDVANLLPNSILTSPIFDMDTIKPLANEDVSKLRTEDMFDDIVAHDDVKKQLRELEKDPSQYPALLQE